MRASRLPAKMISALALGLALSACTTTRVGTDRLAEKDPLEGFNRTIWAVNRGADKVVVKPVTQVYRAVAPKPARDGVRNFFANVGEPFSFINNVLQGKPDRAVRNLGRFLINTTVGIGGLFDQASRVGVRPATEDFGQTLAVWGANGGPYLVLPLLGPSTLRDGVGTGVSQLADPYRVCLRECDLPKGLPTGMNVLEIISVRDGLIEAGADGFLESSLDPYAAARSAFLQRRRAEILNQDGDDAAAEAAAAADAEANPITDDGLGAADTDAGIPGTDTAPSPDATPAPNASETAAEPGNPASSEETKQPN
jgi:phospholipid-binding lipoprotein MlaA